MIRYWTAIDQGRYRAAQNLYSDQWASKGAFARDEAQYDPGVDLESLKVKPRTPPTNGFVTLTVGVVTYDRAGTYQGVCRQWGGWVRR